MFCHILNLAPEQFIKVVKGLFLSSHCYRYVNCPLVILILITLCICIYVTSVSDFPFSISFQLLNFPPGINKGLFEIIIPNVFIGSYFKSPVNNALTLMFSSRSYINIKTPV